jgi:hypothetical protein
MRYLRPTLALAITLTVATACSNDGPEIGPPGPRTVVKVKLEDNSIVPDVDPVEAGRVVLEVRSSGPQKRHELLMVRSDAPADELPVRGDGSVETEGMEFVAKVDALGIGGAALVDLDLATGRYVMFCNLVDRPTDGSLESHYKLRMHSVLTVVAPPSAGVPGALTPLGP